jgi:5-methyltetrahydropteroyltriglutamate--homocysteine methyltransferase
VRSHVPWTVLTDPEVAQCGITEADARKRFLNHVEVQVAGWQLDHVGVTEPIDPKVETAQQVRDRVLEAADYVPVERLETTDDCGFAHDDSGSRRSL